MTPHPKSIASRRGQHAGRSWIITASPMEVIKLAGSEFTYGSDTLSVLRSEGFQVPPSRDPDFSFGFFKAVRRLAIARIKSYQSMKDLEE
jgi:hypothetical protein